jgi:ParB-like chromosome segregation protein Spo0J
VRVPPDVDEEGNIIDGKRRKQICDELGIEYPVRVLAGLTEAQKLEHAYQVNVARRQLRKAQKRQLAKKLWHDGQTQERIAQLLGVSQSTVANWVPEFIKSDKLPTLPPSRVKMGSSIHAGKPGAAQPSRRRRTDLRRLKVPLMRVMEQPTHGNSRNRHNRATPILRPGHLPSRQQ